MTAVSLLGHNLAMLVAATELVQRGRGVVLHTDGRALGAHFAGLQVEGLSFDIGMVMLEQCGHPQPSDDLRGYRPQVRNDWTRYGHLAARWLGQRAELVRVPTPRCRLQGRTGPDYLIANRLDMLADLRLAAERLPLPATLAAEDPRHPRHKVDGEAYEHLSYQDAAWLCHGQALHELAIEPFVRKLLGQGSARFMARYHRAAWAPLYYPETVRAALLGEPTQLAEYPFWMPASGCVGDLVRGLGAALLASGRVTLNTQPLVTLTPQGVPPQALGLPVERCMALLQGTRRAASDAALPSPPAAASVVLGFCRVRAEAISQLVRCLMVVDEDFASYRLTDQDHLARRDEPWHRVTIEASPEGLSRVHPGCTPQAALAIELAALLGVARPEDVQVLQTITARQALAWPSTEAIAAGQQTARCLGEALPGVLLTGTLLGYGVASLNDQIVQGLMLAEELS